MIHIAHRVQTLNTVIKALLIGAFLFAVGYRLIYAQDISSIWDEFSSKLSSGQIWILGIVIVLMPLNWLLEAGKWRLLMRPALNIPFRTSLNAVLSGISISLFTPNRIGEYGGRILYVPSRYNWRAILATLVGSFAQNLVHIAFGLGAVVMFLLSGEVLPGVFTPGMVLIVAMILLVLILAYANLSTISGWLDRIEPVKFLRKPWAAFKYLGQITQHDLGIALGFASLRYLIFSTQFILLLLFFQAEVPIEWIIAGVAVMFLVQTSIPLPPFVDVVARSQLALILWAGYNVNELAVVSASFLLWIINLLVPAFFGLLAMSRVNVLQSLGYEENMEMATDNDSIVDAVVGATGIDSPDSFAAERRPGSKT